MAIEPSEMNQSEFMDTFGHVFEHSPWIVENVWYGGLETRHDTAAGLHEALSNQIRRASAEDKLELLRAHPELAGSAAEEDLTAASRGEQRRSGLDRCTPAELAEFTRLNEAYREKFGFPFIMAIKGYQPKQILEIFQQRLQHSPEEELQTALGQVIRIGLFRLQEIFGVKPATTRPARLDRFVDLAQPRLGAEVIFATDDFFAPKERLIDPNPPIFIDGKYDDHGKWMDGWESRRKERRVMIFV